MNKDLRDPKYIPKRYSRVLTNKMTMIAWRMYKSNPDLHFGFILYRMKKDLNFTIWELSNFTGIPSELVYRFMRKVKPLMEAEVLKDMAKFEYGFKHVIEEWYSLPCFGKPQGYYTIKNKPAWYNKRYSEEPEITYGGESEKEYEEKIS